MILFRTRTGFNTFFCLLLAVSTIGFSAIVGSEDLEFKVNTGDSKTYTVTSYYNDHFLSYEYGVYAEDNDPTQDTYFVVTKRAENGTPLVANYTMKKGTTIKVDILQGSPQEPSIANGSYFITYSITYNNRVTSLETYGYCHYVSSTIDNRSYWENYASTYSNKYNTNTSYYILTLDGDYLVYTTESTLDNGVTFSTILRRNWKTGWLSSESTKAFNQSKTYFEFEYREIIDLITPSFLFIPSISVFMLIILVRLRFQRRK